MKSHSNIFIVFSKYLYLGLHFFCGGANTFIIIIIIIIIIDGLLIQVHIFISEIAQYV